ncbi:MAG: alkyl/aryl-sulfatase [Alphaproteobacteria bacterium]
MSRLSSSKFVLLVAVAVLSACARSEEPFAPSRVGRAGGGSGAASGEADAHGATDASAATANANRQVAESLPIDDPRDFEDAKRGLVGREERVRVEAADGRVIWDLGDYDFVAGDAPPSVNPSLWRQAKLNGVHGLFEVAPGIYQVRGYDVSNMTIIVGKTGWIVVDPLTCQETATAAFALARKHLGNAPVVAVIFTHSHLDHFGGVEAVMPEDPEARRKVRVIAPRGFIEEATSENIFAGPAMIRRAGYMYGMPLPKNARGHVDTGLGKQPAWGTISIAEPTDLVDRAPQEMEVDGIRFVFMYAPHSEAPAETTFYLPDAKAFCSAEIVSHVMHNLLTLRGAKVRDPVLWSGYIDAAMTEFRDAQVVFGSHSWPVWGNERGMDLLAKQRDMYRFMNDQSLRLANRGARPQEIAERIRMPESLAKEFADRGYYGTLRHNSKAVYQHYFGWYDGNPAHLDPLPPVDASKRYVEAMGGSAPVIEQARAAHEAADDRWAAMLLDHVVFAEPDNTQAKELLAQVYDQLGYRAESGPWRDIYLTGAYELRHGVASPPMDTKSAAHLLEHLDLSRFFDSMATRLDSEKAEGKRVVINFIFTDENETHVVELSNSVLHHHRKLPDPAANATIRLTRPFLVKLATGQAGLRDLVFSDSFDVEGSRMDVLGFFSMLDKPDGTFPIVTP